MRIASYLLILLGVYLLVCATYDEINGVTMKPESFRTGRHFRNDAYQYRIPVEKKNMPDVFRRFMRLHWIYACAAVVAGVILLWIDTRPNGP